MNEGRRRLDRLQQEGLLSRRQAEKGYAALDYFEGAPPRSFLRRLVSWPGDPVDFLATQFATGLIEEPEYRNRSVRLCLRSTFLLALAMVTAFCVTSLVLRLRESDPEVRRIGAWILGALCSAVPLLFLPAMALVLRFPVRRRCLRLRRAWESDSTTTTR